MIYEPAEDSFLLKKHINFTGKKVLDMGTGSGILALEALAKGNDVTAVDINPEAIENLKSYSKKMELILSDLFEKVDGKFDIIMFNSPYLPTDNEDVIWDGGPSGRDVIEKFADQAGPHLKENGKILLLISSLTGVDETISLFKGYETKIIDRQKIPWEELIVLEIMKKGA